MKKSIKWIFFIKHIARMSTINKVRFILSSLGIFVAVFLFSVGLIITTSYYNENMKMIEDMVDNVAILSSDLDNYKLKSELSFGKNTIFSSVDTLNEKKSILSTQLSDEQYLTIMSYVHGVSDMNQIMPIMTNDDTLIPVGVNLLKGRLISKSDISTKEKVVIIDEFTEEMLFPGEDSIGKYIEIGVAIGGAMVASDEEVESIKLQVIGVVENSYVSDVSKLFLKQDIVKNEKNIFSDVSIYCPISILDELFGDADSQESLFCQVKDKQYYKDFVDKATMLAEIKEKTGGNLSVNTKEILLDNLEENLSSTKTIINLITFVLCLISGISIMSITFFSVKERIPEIGIRKAFGASKVDIIFQFVFEMVIIALFASIFAVLLSFVSCKLLGNYLIESLYMPFSVEISIELLLLPLLIGVLEAVICSIVPSLYAAKIKVTDSLRFE